jgi:hypothetical protein
LSATEIVRRCERRIGELVRQGQAEGTVSKPGDNVRTDLLARMPGGLNKMTVTEAAGVGDYSALKPLRTMADAPADEFEQALAEAKANLYCDPVRI